MARDTEFKGVISENVAGGGRRKSNHIFSCHFFLFFPFPFFFFVRKMRVRTTTTLCSPRYRFFYPYLAFLLQRDFLTRGMRSSWVDFNMEREED